MTPTHLGPAAALWLGLAAAITSCAAPEQGGDAGLRDDGGGGGPGRAEAPEILRFTIEPDVILEGGRITASWEIVGATRVDLTGSVDGRVGEGLPLEGSLDLGPTASQTYTLVAVGPTGLRTSARDEVSVRPPPMASLQVDKTTVPIGGEVRLTWQVRHASVVRLRAGDTLVFEEAEQDHGVVRYRVDRPLRFVLEASAMGVVARDEVQVDLLPMPEIVSFTADATMVGPGDTVTLSWETREAREVEITSDGRPLRAAPLPLSGSLDVILDRSARFTLVATGLGGSVSEAVSVEVVPRPEILSFQVDPEVVAPGQAATLSWLVTAADTVAITNETTQETLAAGLPTEGEFQVLADRTSRFVLAATGPGGEASDTVELEVIPRPTIRYLGADPERLPERVGETTLSWAVDHADSVTLYEDGRVVASNLQPTGEISVSELVPPGATFQLMAANPIGDAVAEVRVTVVAAPRVLRFSASAAAVHVGETVTLDWEVADARVVEIFALPEGNAGGPVGEPLLSTPAPQGSLEVTVARFTTYELVATGEFDVASASVDVVAGPAGPVEVSSFEAHPRFVPFGQSLTLTWEVSNAYRVDIVGPSGQTTEVDPDATSMVVTPTMGGAYRIEAVGVDGSDLAVVEVGVGPDQPLLSEVFPNAVGGDDGLEWVELHNPTATPLDLTGWSLGSGGADYTYSTLDLHGVIPAFGCFLVGGPNSSQANGSPELDLPVDFDPDIQNGGPTADGLALFHERAEALTRWSVPVDAVVYGDHNDHGLLGPDGEPAATTYPPPRGDGTSLARVSMGSWDISPPTPGVCLPLEIVSLRPSVVEQGSTQPLVISARGLKPPVAVHIQASILDCERISWTELQCESPGRLGPGTYDVVVRNGDRTTRVLRQGFTVLECRDCPR